MKLFEINAGTFSVDGGAAFGVVPKRVWQKRYPADEENFCKVTMRCVLLEVDNRLILFETGTGDKQLEYLKYYNFEHVINFDEEFAKLGYSCDQVTDVVFSHLHFDHSGGATRYNAAGEIELVFPNARHWVGEAQWKNFKNPNVREGDSYFTENLQPIADAGKLCLVSETTKLCSAVEMRLYDGHTVGQVASYIDTPKGTYVYVGDVIPLAANIPLAWVSSYDVYPLRAMEDKERMLAEAAEKNQTLIFVHDVYTPCATVKETNGKYRMNEALPFYVNE
jgi:glyoxylase-like metal-dependent hydrolase (beta-lactamase superfamily II)